MTHAICDDCKQEMNGVGCTHLYAAIGDSILRRDTFHFGEESGICNDCGAPHGKIHHFGCDVERCPRCGGQFFASCCYDEEPKFFREGAPNIESKRFFDSEWAKVEGVGR